LKLQRITIPSEDIELAGLAYLPDKIRLKRVIVLSHGLTASKESMDLLASYLAMKGYPCISYDCRGHKLGATGGLLNSAAQLIKDLEFVCTYTAQMTGVEDVVTIGHSMGGLLSLSAAGSLSMVCAVCVIASGPNPVQGFRGVVGSALLRQRADYLDGISPAELLVQLGELYQGLNVSIEKPSLFLAAREDPLVRSGKMKEMALRYGDMSSFQQIDGNHLEAPARARGVIMQWLENNYSCLHPDG
jgi:dienelactone hydrolase